MLNDIRHWLDGHLEGARQQKDSLGKTLTYLHNQWDRLCVFTQDVRLHLDNNYAEGHIRPVAVGRKNWLFCQSPDGAHAAAAWYSIVETAKANGLEPYHYLKWLFVELPIRLAKGDRLEPCLPWNITPDQISIPPSSCG